jgi:hypothetical protein
VPTGAQFLISIFHSDFAAMSATAPSINLALSQWLRSRPVSDGINIKT